MTGSGDPLALSKERPELSAHIPILLRQKLLVVVASLLLLALLWWDHWAVAKAFVLVSTVFYLLFTLYKLALVRLSVSR